MAPRVHTPAILMACIGVGLIHRASGNVWTLLNTAGDNMTFSTYQGGLVNLQNGSVLAAGGAYNKTGKANSFRNRTQIWEAPTSGARARRDHWRPGPEMLFGRSEFGLATLTDGRVMAAGGDVYSGGYVKSTWANLVEVLEPLTGQWNLVKNLTVPRQACVLAALPDGGALVIGGKHSGRFETTGIASAERWDPVTNAWSTVTNMSHGRYLAAAVTLLDGSIVVTGGRNERGRETWSAERYSAKEDTWTPFANMTTKRVGHGLVALSNGSILAVGGFDGSNNLQSAEIYMPVEKIWVAVDSMWVKRAGCRATLLPGTDDRVMVVGASSNSFDRSVELYQGGRYRCYAEDGKTGCHPVANTDPGGVDIDTCRDMCGQSPPAPPMPPHFRCIANKCVEIPGLDGTTKPDCEKICGADTGGSEDNGDLQWVPAAAAFDNIDTDTVGGPATTLEDTGTGSGSGESTWTWVARHIAAIFK